MNSLIVKNVDVFGDSIRAVMDKDGVIWAGVSYFCNALGMTKGQKDRQVQNVQKDIILKRGASNFEAGVFDASNETIALRIDHVPLWLTRIQITPSMKKEHPELADKLLNYQLKAKDILAAAFLPKQQTENLPMTTQEQIKLLAQGNVELNQRVDKVTEDVQSVREEIETLKNELPILPLEADNIVNAVKKKGVEVLGGKASGAYNNRNVRQKLYNDLYGNLKHNFNVRTYKAIQRKDAQKAVMIVNQYTPPLFLQEQIEGMNGKGGEL